MYKKTNYLGLDYYNQKQKDFDRYMKKLEKNKGSFTDEQRERIRGLFKRKNEVVQG